MTAGQPPLRTGDQPPADDARKPAPDPTGSDLPAAGPHADEALTDKLKTPGSGAMPDVGEAGEDVDPGTG